MSVQPPTVSDGDALREAYERDGFFVCERLFDEEECRQWKAEALRLLREQAVPDATVFVGAAAASPVFYAAASHPRLTAVLRQIMPDGVAFLSDKIVFKSGRKTFATPWHADAAYWANTRPKLSVWIALDAVRAENGALKVLPGSHHRDWRHEQGDGAQTNREFQRQITPDWEASQERVCALDVGGAIVFSDRLLHASCPNTAGADRYSLISTYHAPQPEEAFDAAFPARHVIP